MFCVQRRGHPGVPGAEHGRDAVLQGSVPDPNPDSDPLVRGMDPDPALDSDPSIIVQK